MSLVLPGSAAPSNLHLAPHQVNMHVEGDVFNICERIRTEVPQGDRLFVVMQEDHPKPYVVMEKSDDNVERFVCRTDALDGRLIARLQYLINVPFEKRFAEAERLEQKLREEAHEQELDDLWNSMGERMHFQLERDNFIDSRGKSLPLSLTDTGRRHRKEAARRAS
jgi:hypothetical protein